MDNTATNHNFIRFVVLLIAAFLLGVPASSQTVAVGSLIIPMDDLRSTSSGGQNGVLLAYGLVYDLISHGVAVRWAFSTTKNHADASFSNGVDFTAPSNSVKRRRGNGAAGTSIGTSVAYRGSMFIIAVPDTAVAGPRLRTSTFDATVAVHQVLTALTAVPVQYTLTQIPKAYIEDRQSGNLHLITDVFTDAGIPSAAYTTSSTGVPIPSSLSGTGAGCYSMIMVPHEGTMTNADVTNMKAFADDGGNVALQCRAIDDFENFNGPGAVLTTGGVRLQSDVTWAYPDAGAQMAIGQFIGTAEASPNSYVYAWDLGNGASYNAGAVHVVQRSSNTNYNKIMSIRKDNDNTKGLFTFFGGHTYHGDQNVSRAMLNAFLLPAQRGLCTPLPVELVSFSANIVGGSVELFWKTRTEKNNYGFDIERRIDEADWKSVGFVEGHGTINTPQAYSFVDQNAYQGAQNMFYRLRQIDRDGSASYSPVVEVRSNGTIPDAAIQSFSPNPAVAATTMSFQLSADAPVSISIFDMMGRERKAILSGESMEAGSHIQNLDLTGLNAGTYYVILKTGSTSVTSRLIVSH